MEETISGTSGDDVIPLAEALAELKMTKRTFNRYAASVVIPKITHTGRTYVKRQWIRDYWVRKETEGKKEQHTRKRRAARRNSR